MFKNTGGSDNSGLPDPKRRRRRTKIVCTIGPSTEGEAELRALVEAGMDVARLNFSHSTHDWHGERIDLIRHISAEYGYPIGILQDLPGPKVRVGEIPDGPVALQKGARFRLSAVPVNGTAEAVFVTYDRLGSELEPGDTVLLADGSIELCVDFSDPEGVTCTVVEGGELSSYKGINFPDRSLSLPSLTAADREALAFGIEKGVDFVALSFVRTGDDVLAARALMRELGAELPVIAKIEKHEALANLHAIVAAADGILVARGDLAVETPLEAVPQAQKRVIRAANQAGRPVITATQMLRSMVSSPRPTRAETTDVANALYDGTDAVMLSEETTIGEHPVEAVRVMHRICSATESDIVDSDMARPLPTQRRRSVPDAVAAAACVVARHVDAVALLIPTRTGSTAIKVASCRPPQPIVAISTDRSSVGRLTLTWGVASLAGNEVPTHESMLAEAERVAVEAGWLSEGDLVVITAGFPVGGPGTTNTVTVKAIGEELEVGTDEFENAQPQLFGQATDENQGT